VRFAPSLVLLVLVATVAGCGDAARPVPAAQPAPEHVPADPLPVDTRAGTFRGLAFRDSEAAVRKRFGKARCSTTAPMQPLGEDYYDIGGPTHFVPPRGKGLKRDCFMRYRRLVVLMFSGGAYGFVSTDTRAQTEQGVGPGDPQALVRERYPGARCEVANEGTEWSTFPLCTVVLAPGKRLYFGGDPIRSVWLIATSRRALG
jgi:hypothetical protein